VSTADDVMRTEWHRERARAWREDPPPIDDRPTLAELEREEWEGEE
jgi:hypothetical protein